MPLRLTSSAAPPDPARILPERFPPERVLAEQFLPRRSRLPAVVSALAVLVVAAVVVVATLTIPKVSPARVEADPQPVSRVAAPSTTATGAASAIDISSDEGAGQLAVLKHFWSVSPRAPGASQLRVEVQLVCSRGRIDYNPYFFQAFDATGRLYEMSDARARHSLATGTITAGQRVRGVVTFDLPRGEVTLLMTDDDAQLVTALRVPS